MTNHSAPSTRTNASNRRHRAATLAPVAGILAALLITGCSSDNSDSDEPVVVSKLEQDVETRLALSAGPAHIRDQAGVYLHNPATGLEESKESQNGYNCFVGRTDIQAMQLGNVEYRDDILIPICFDATGSESIMPIWLHAESERAAGATAAELNESVKSVAAAAPRAGVAPMLSPILRTFTGPGTVGNINYPHYMYYAPGVTNDDIAAVPFSPTHAWIDNGQAFEGKNAYIIQAVGTSERAAINMEHKDLLEDLCAERTDGAFCMDMTTINSDLRAQLQATLTALDAD